MSVTSLPGRVSTEANVAMQAETPKTIPAEAHSRRVRNLRSEVLDAVASVIDSGVYHSGAHTQTLQERTQAAWGGHAVATNSGTMALETAIRALDLGPGDEVIVPSLTFAATAFAVSAAGAKPVFADIDPVSRTLTAATVQEVLTERTRAVVPVHMYGLMADMTSLGQLAHAKDLRVIEDCAQAAGAQCDGRYAGTFGDFGCFSLWVGKNFGSLGDAGLLLARDPEVLPTLRMLLNLGRDASRDIHHIRGSRGRIDEIDAAVAALQLPLLQRWIDARRANAACYAEAFADLPVALPGDVAGRRHTYYKYPLTFESEAEAERVRGILTEAKVKVEQLYPYQLQEQPAFEQLPHRAPDTSVSADLLPRTLCLPVAPELTVSERDRVTSALLGAY
ncbi:MULTISPECIES: DegT/DnrJ/EryC1/StrS family aminotransferase [unclassified Streptomyces]|uniref:DegT/DnrJ/EryC1/StrS family aminotransferase n=1 Tax=unclassified Streptomyces TaxID=2593676 RepID=UPI002E174FB1|nr:MULTISPECIES: DegT/DnrJ/EryC1/StrS family aminotransferase [unclassified Streptomyces]